MSDGGASDGFLLSLAARGAGLSAPMVDTLAAPRREEIGVDDWGEGGAGPAPVGDGDDETPHVASDRSADREERRSLVPAVSPGEAVDGPPSPSPSSPSEWERARMTVGRNTVERAHRDKASTRVAGTHDEEQALPWSGVLSDDAPAPPPRSPESTRHPEPRPVSGELTAPLSPESRRTEMPIDVGVKPRAEPLSPAEQPSVVPAPLDEARQPRTLSPTSESRHERQRPRETEQISSIARTVADLERRIADSGIGETVPMRPDLAEHDAPRADGLPSRRGGTSAGLVAGAAAVTSVLPTEADALPVHARRPPQPLEIRIGRVEVRAPEPAATPVTDPLPDFSTFRDRRGGGYWRGGR